MTCLLKSGCPCKADCPRHGNCVECIKHHYEESDFATTCMSGKKGTVIVEDAEKKA